MGERSFKLKLISANGLNKLTRVGKMDVYAVAYISGGTVNQDQKQRTYVDKGGDSNPIWNCSMKFTIDEYAASKNRSVLVVKIIMEATLGDKTVGQVHVPIKGLLEGYLPGDKPLRFVSYQVMKPSGKLKGELSFSYKFGASKLEKPTAKPDKVDELVTPCNHVGTYNKLQEPVTGYRSTSLYPSVYEASVDAAPELYQPPAPTAAASEFYQQPAPAAAAPEFYQPPAPAAAAPGFYQPPAPAAAAPGFYQPPAPAAAAPGNYQTPAPAAATLEFYQPPAPTFAAPEFYQPPAPTFAALGFYQPPAPTAAAPGFYQPPAPIAAAPGYFPLAGGANYTPLGYPQPQAGYTYQQQSGYSGYSQLPPMYAQDPLQQSGYGGYLQSPRWYHGYPLKHAGYNVYSRQQSGYGGYPQPPVYNGYLPHQSGYGGNRWCSQQAGYGSYPSPPGGHCGYPSKTADHPPVQNKKHKLGLGFGVWLLAVVGGLVLGRILLNATAFGGYDGGC